MGAPRRRSWSSLFVRHLLYANELSISCIHFYDLPLHIVFLQVRAIGLSPDALLNAHNRRGRTYVSSPPPAAEFWDPLDAALKHLTKTSGSDLKDYKS